MSFYSIPIVFILLQILQFAIPFQAAENKANKVEVTILVNEGLLIRAGNLAVLVDAFTKAQEVEGDSELTTIHRDMLAGNPPFSSIQLALVSHPHPEHFFPTIASTFLRNHPETILASSPAIIQAIRDESSGYPAIKDQLKEIKTDKGEVTSLTLPGIQVDFIPFNHEASIFYPGQVLAHVIHLGSRKILHIGDTEMRPENWQLYDLKSQKIDIALVPFWLFKEEITRTIIDEYVAPQKVVVVQILSKGLKKKANDLSRIFPEVIFLSTTMTSTKF